MSYRVRSSHVETLHDGRMVEPGASISDAEAKKNPRLVERGVLEKEPGRQRAQNTTAAPSEPADAPAPEQEKEESK